MRPIAPVSFGDARSRSRRGLGAVIAGLMASAIFLATSAAVAGPSPQLPQIEVLSCFGCNLGIFDQPQMTSNRGVMGIATPKDIYVGIQFSPPFSALTGIEFSIAGIRAAEDGILVLGTDALSPGALLIGAVQAPPDTSATSVGVGGMVAAWNSCQNGNRALLKVTLLSLGPIAKVITLTRRYPTTNTTLWHTPVFVLCDNPGFTAVRLSGGCYGINMPPGPLPCDGVVAVDRTTWSRLKSLYN